MGCHPSHWRTPSFFKMVKTTNQKILSNASNCQSTSPLNRWQNLRCLRRPLQRHRDAFFCRSDKFDPFLAYLLHTRYYHHPFHLVTSSYCSKEDHPQMASFQQCSLVTGNDSDRFHGNSDQPALTPRTVRCQGPHCLWEERCSLHQAARFFLGQGVQVNVLSLGGVSKCISNGLTHRYLDFTLITFNNHENHQNI